MKFLQLTDFNGIIATSIYNQLKGTDSANADKAELLAITELAPLQARYNISAELAKSSTSRNEELIRILVHITAYYLYNVVEDDSIPVRITTNYKNQTSIIEKIANGKLYTTLTPILNSDSTTKSVYRFGGNEPRDNDIF